MKKLLFILFSFFIHFGFGQNWELFPYGQKSFYIQLSTLYYQDSLLQILTQDSIFEFDDEKQLFFNTQTPYSEYQDCYNLLQEVDYSMVQYSLPVNKNELVENNLIGSADSTVYSNLSINDDPFVFYNHLNIGQSWQFYPNSDYSLYDVLTIVVDSSKYIELVPGIFDSVKYFSMHPDQFVDSPILYDTLKIVLSKNYGLIIFPSFDQILRGNYLTNYFLLKGFDISGNRYGDIYSGWKSFFPMNAGDVKKYEFENLPSGPNLYQGNGIIYDSIISTTNLPDQLIFEGKRKTFNTDNYLYDSITYTLYIYRSAYENFLDGANDIPIFTNLGDSLSELKLYYNSDIHVYSENNKLVYFREFATLGGIEDFNLCEIPDPWVADAGNSNFYDDMYGFIAYYAGDGISYSNSLMLKAARVGENTFGDLSLPPIFIDTVADVPNPQLETLIYPNPVESELNINYDSTYLYDFVIYDVQGQKMREGEIINQKIRVVGLHNGMYILQIHTGAGMMYEKFIKM